MKLITRIYYRCYDAQRLVGNEDIAKHTALLMITFAVYVMIINVFLFSHLIFNISIVLDRDISLFNYVFSNKEISILSMVIIYLMFLLVVFNIYGFEKIVEENKEETQKQRKRKAVITWISFFGIILLGPITMLITVW